MSNLISSFIRQSTAALRPLPDFIIIGAQKAGTTSLFSYLAQHPQVNPSLIKEVHYFDGGLNPEEDSYEKGPSWYRAHFPLKRTHHVTGEASPLYMIHPLVPERMFRLIPNVKIIALLRNPVDRAISHYFHEKQKGREKLPALEAFLKEEKRLEPVLMAKDFKNEIFKNHTYKTRGLYRKHIENFLKYYQMSSILVITSDELFNNPAETLKKIFRFLKVDPEASIGDLSPKNIGRNKIDIGSEACQYLMNYFFTRNQELYELMGQDLGWS